MAKKGFDHELDRVVELLNHEVRRAVMAFYVNEATTPAQISRTVDIDLPTVAYHTRVLEQAGALKSLGADSLDGSRQSFEATELGILGLSKLSDEE
jgi:DNA-binding transcriptional ArsR family regulator